MADLAAIRDEFAAAFEAGESPDLRAFLGRVGESERQELESLIDGYLMTAPRRAWDPEAYERSLAKVAIDRVYDSRDGVSGTWPEVLPRLRNRARILREDLVQRLADALGAGSDSAKVEKIGVFYNEMEHGNLPAEGVSERVLTALAGLLDAPVEALRDAGTRRFEAAGGSAPAFARLADADEDFSVASKLDELAAPAAPASPGTQASPAERDEIDELFLGG